MSSLLLPFLRFPQRETNRGIGHVFFVIAIFKVPPKRIYERYRTCPLSSLPFLRFLHREFKKGI
jgi:hypothetical protein